MQFFSVLTLENPHYGCATVYATVNICDGATRHSVYKHMREQAIKKYGPQFEHANVMFFSAEPNAIKVADA